MADLPKYVTLQELAVLLHVKPATIRSWVKNNPFPDGAVLKIARTLRFDHQLVVSALSTAVVTKPEPPLEPAEPTPAPVPETVPTSVAVKSRRRRHVEPKPLSPIDGDDNNV